MKVELKTTPAPIIPPPTTHTITISGLTTRQVRALSALFGAMDMNEFVSITNRSVNYGRNSFNAQGFNETDAEDFESVYYQLPKL